ncbi:glycosyltransferase [Pseudodonghicola xiamenensis]|uniref:Uncharacterized protein n=1 Tax=Pseudodonghicola xiamenensis TaxID=337702 RepID=A0A8J3HA37_9RHOB|nr:glycosyltransferase family 4 protein [Pseudodonghicola xiamenensis]GHG95508.1 hypothetical protein GCM10010961_29280 [Pseudodonghicola xiamenensis]
MLNEKTSEASLERDPILRVSAANYNPDTRELFVRGWRLLKGREGRILIHSASGPLLGEAKQGKTRSDVYKDYPEYGDRRAGWECRVWLPEGESVSQVRVALIDADDDRELLSTSMKVSTMKPAKDSAKNKRFALTMCNYDTESRLLEIEGEAYPELPLRRLLVQLGNGLSAPVNEIFLPSPNQELRTGGVVNRFGGFRSQTRFVGQGALSSVAVVAELINGEQVGWSIARDQIRYDQPKARITGIKLDYLRDRLRCEGWFRSYETVTSISLSLGGQDCHGIPKIVEDRELTQKLGFRGPQVQRFVYDLPLSEALNDPEALIAADLNAQLSLQHLGKTLGQFTAEASAIQQITAKATMIVFDRRNSTLMVWGECAAGCPPKAVELQIAGRTIGSPLIPVVPDFDPTADITSWFVAGEVNFDLAPNHKVELQVTSGKTQSTEMLAGLPKPIIVSANNQLLSPSDVEATQLIYDHDIAERRLPEPVVCFALQGTILNKGGGTTRVRNMMQGFKAAGYSVVLCDRTAPWDYLKALDDYKDLRRYCDAHLTIPQAYKPGVLRLALNELKEVKSPTASTRRLTSYVERALKSGRLMKKEGEPFYDRVDSQFNYAVAAVMHHLAPDVLISQFAWSCEMHTALPDGTYGMIDTHDIQSARYKAFSKALELYGPAAIPKLDKFRVGPDAERTMLGMASACIAISPDEKAELDEMIGARNTVLAMPTSQSMGFVGSAPESQSVLFVGNDYEANNFGIAFFLQEIWPSIRQAVGTAHLNIVGSCGDAVAQHADDHVTIHGVVGDILPLYRDAAVIINPVLFGTGIAMKMTEALSNGKAIVASTVGARGFDQAVEAGVILREDAPEDFARAVAGLLSSPEDRAAMERAAYDYAGTYLRPDVLYSNLFNFLESKLFY